MPKITVRCSTCNAPLLRWPFQVRGNVSGTYFCSSECDGAYKRVGSITKSGYIWRQVAGERARDHRRVVEQALGRKLRPTEVVHHIDGDKLNNSLENLAVLTQREHMREHKPLSFDIERAERLIRDGLPLEDVGQKLGVTAHVIESAFARRGRRINDIRGLARGARVDWRLEQITELAKEGRTVQQIAETFGASSASLKRFLKQRGMTVTGIRSG